MCSRLISLTSLSILFSLTAAQTPVEAEWGYEPKPEEVKPVELKAGSAGLLNSLQPKVKPGSVKPKTPTTAPAAATAAPALTPPSLPVTAPAKPTPPKSSAFKKNQAPVKLMKGPGGPVVSSWIELFDIVSAAPLIDQQKSRFRAQLEADLASKDPVFTASVNQFWPLVKKRIGSDAEQKLAFSQMFRALLRFEVKGKKLSEADANMLAEVLGPERIARPGNPALTEEAVDAYGDMACFLYELAHPGKSVDAYDNRAVFAEVIYGKFNNAPTMHDKRAMCNFALTWTKFKVTWLSAGEDEKKTLLTCITKSRPIPKELADPLVESIFHQGPWSKIVLPKEREPLNPESQDQDMQEPPVREQEAQEQPREQVEQPPQDSPAGQQEEQ